MPIYEYRCNSCDEVFEVFQKMTDPPPQEHTCGGKEVTRLLSNTSFRLVGTGWYATDYAAKPTAPKSESSPGSASQKNEAKDGAGAHKPEAKPKATGEKTAKGAS